MRKLAGVALPGPKRSSYRSRYAAASAILLRPPEGFKPTLIPRCFAAAMAYSMTAAAGSVAAG